MDRWIKSFCNPSTSKLSKTTNSTRTTIGADYERDQSPFISNKSANPGQGPMLASVNFPSLYIRRRSAGPKKITGERERVVGETVSRKTQEWFNEETGTVEIRTVEIVEKIIEHEVFKCKL